MGIGVLCQNGRFHTTPLVSGSGFLAAAFFILATRDRGDRSLHPERTSSPSRRFAIVLAHRFSVSPSLLALADLESLRHPPSPACPRRRGPTQKPASCRRAAILRGKESGTNEKRVHTLAPK